MPEPRFRPCRQNQPMLLPPDISDLIPANAMARLVDAVVGRMDRRLLESLYPGGGAPARDPAMMLKVVPFCYASGIYSSRKIAAATRENVNLMWLTGMEPLDHNTVNRFRTERVRPVFEDVFAEVIAVLAEAGHVTLETYFLDGTKVEADANRFSFTWRKGTLKYRDRLREKVGAHLAEIDTNTAAGTARGARGGARASRRRTPAPTGRSRSRPSRPSSAGARAPCCAPRRDRDSGRGGPWTSRPPSETSIETSASPGSR